MEIKDKENRKLKFGLALKKFMEKAGQIVQEDVKAINKVKQDKIKSLSFRKLETNSGIRHATIVEIVNGKKNPAWTTVDALLEGLEISLSDFALIYDRITGKEIEEYREQIEKRKQLGNKKQKLKSQKTPKKKK